MKTLATMIAAAFALVLQGAFADADAINANGHCTGMTVTDYVSSDVTDETTSATWANITDGHLNFTTSSTGCVVITFSAEAFAEPGGDLEVRTLLDGNQLCVPADSDPVFLAAPGPNMEQGNNSVTHVCKNVTAGAHTAQMQYNAIGTGAAGIAGHVLTITHN